MPHQYDYGQQKIPPGDFVLRFGKFKGKRLRDVEDLACLDHYLKWDDLREEARDAISAWLKLPQNRDELEEQLLRRNNSR